MSTSAAYHHGDLKHALVEAALVALTEGGTDALGLRDLARRVGVSPAAPYRHFRDKQALIQAVAAAGFARFLATIEAATTDGTPVEHLAAMAEAYVGFALANPALYRLMFSAELGRFEDRGLREAAEAAYSSLAVAAARVDTKTPAEAAISAWAFVHGLAMLLLDNQLLGVTPSTAGPLVRVLARRHAAELGRA